MVAVHSQAAVKPGSCYIEGGKQAFGAYLGAVRKLYLATLGKGVIKAHSPSFMDLFMQHLCVPGTLLK